MKYLILLLMIFFANAGKIATVYVAHANDYRVWLEFDRDFFTGHVSSRLVEGFKGHYVINGDTLVLVNVVHHSIYNDRYACSDPSRPTLIPSRLIISGYSLKTISVYDSALKNEVPIKRTLAKQLLFKKVR
jgi:hypothetical protein